MNVEQDPVINVNGIEYDRYRILVQKCDLEESINKCNQNTHDFLKIFLRLESITLNIDSDIIQKISRLAGTSLLEAGYILRSISSISTVPGDWCEYGVAHGRTSALLALLLSRETQKRKLWLYDSFEGLPVPHSKDVLLNDIFGKGSMEAYAGEISFPEEHVVREVSSVIPADLYTVTKGWITPDLLKNHSPSNISFAYLDMDFYQSTYDVLNFLVDSMPPGGVAVIDDYGVFSDGVRVAVTEILQSNPNAFSFEQPFGDKFAILTRN